MIYFLLCQDWRSADPFSGKKSSVARRHPRSRTDSAVAKQSRIERLRASWEPLSFCQNYLAGNGSPTAPRALLVVYECQE